MHGWVLSFADVDAIEVNHGGAIQRFSANDYAEFDVLKSLLNPFASAVIIDDNMSTSGFHGNQNVDLNSLEWAAGISYFIGDEELFDADVYVVPDGIFFHGINEMAFSFNGQRAVVVLDASGWFGAFYEGAEVLF